MVPEDYERLRGRLEAAVRSVCPGWLLQSRDDIVQTGVMAVMRIATRREEDRAFPASYLQRVAYSAVVDEIRRRRSRKEIPLDAVTEIMPASQTTDASPFRRYAGRQISLAIHRCLARLGEPRKQAVALHLLGYRRLQIAERMGWNRKRASNLVFRGLGDLRACLRTMGITP